MSVVAGGGAGGWWAGMGRVVPEGGGKGCVLPVVLCCGVERAGCVQRQLSSAQLLCT